jgi:hypothetical protein
MKFIIFGHGVAGSIAVKHFRVCVPLGVLTFQGPTKFTCTIYQGLVSASLTGSFSYCVLVFLLN